MPGIADVLVVEDHALVAAYLAAILRGAGLHVVTSSCVEEAIDLCRVVRFGAVVIDHLVEGMAGDSFLDAPRVAPVVIVSGLDPYSAVALSRRHADKVFGTVQKPVRDAELIEMVQAAMADTRIPQLVTRDG